METPRTGVGTKEGETGHGGVVGTVLTSRRGPGRPFLSPEGPKLTVPSAQGRVPTSSPGVPSSFAPRSTPGPSPPLTPGSCSEFPRQGSTSVGPDPDPQESQVNRVQSPERNERGPGQTHTPLSRAPAVYGRSYMFHVGSVRYVPGPDRRRPPTDTRTERDPWGKDSHRWDRHRPRRDLLKPVSLRPPPKTSRLHR